MERLRDCIARYAREEALPDDLTPIRSEKLSNFDLFHFGWNMAEYFDIGKKYEVVPWLQPEREQGPGLSASLIEGAAKAIGRSSHGDYDPTLAEWQEMLKRRKKKKRGHGISR